MWMVGWVGRWRERRKGERDAGKRAGRLVEILEKGAGLGPGGREEANESGPSDLNRLFL